MEKLNRPSRRAFTLIELLMVIAIIAILTIAFLPGALKAPAKARDAERNKEVQDIAAALEAWAAEKSGDLPVANINFCLDATASSALQTLAGNFSSNNTFPTDPRPQGLGACDTAALSNRYFYKRFGTGSPYQYVVGARMEIAASGNTSYCVNTAAVGAASTCTNDLETVAATAVGFTAIAGETEASGAGTGSGKTPDPNTPFFIILGPR